MTRIYQALLRLYPRDLRELFSAEMTSTFAESAEEFRSRGWAPWIAFVLRELSSLVTGAATEWIGRARMTRTMPTPDFASEGNADSLPLEVFTAQRWVEFMLKRMVIAIAHRDYKGARRWSDEERKARATLRLLREKYGLGEVS